MAAILPPPARPDARDKAEKVLPAPEGPHRPMSKETFCRAAGLNSNTREISMQFEGGGSIGGYGGRSFFKKAKVDRQAVDLDASSPEAKNRIYALFARCIVFEAAAVLAVLAFGCLTQI